MLLQVRTSYNIRDITMILNEISYFPSTYYILFTSRQLRPELAQRICNMSSLLERQGERDKDSEISTTVNLYTPSSNLSGAPANLRTNWLIPIGI